MHAHVPPFGQFPLTRPRRNRRHPWLRRLVAENGLTPDDFIWPVFIQEGAKQRTPVPSMPGVDRLSLDLLVDSVKEARDLGIPAVALCPATPADRKSPDGDEALNPENLVCRAVLGGPRDQLKDCRMQRIYQGC